MRASAQPSTSGATWHAARWIPSTSERQKTHVLLRQQHHTGCELSNCFKGEREPTDRALLFGYLHKSARFICFSTWRLLTSDPWWSCRFFWPSVESKWCGVFGRLHQQSLPFTMKVKVSVHQRKHCEVAFEFPSYCPLHPLEFLQHFRTWRVRRSLSSSYFMQLHRHLPRWTASASPVFFGASHHASDDHHDVSGIKIVATSFEAHGILSSRRPTLPHCASHLVQLQ